MLVCIHTRESNLDHALTVGLPGCTTQGNWFIYQARESSLVPAGFLTAQFLQEKVIYEAFVVMGELMGLSALIA